MEALWHSSQCSCSSRFTSTIDILDGTAADVLPKLLATRNAGRMVWAAYALLPLMWILSRCRSPVSEGTAQCQLASAREVDGARENPRSFLRCVKSHRVFGFDEIGKELRLPLVVAG